MATFTYIPTRSSSVAVEPRTSTATFGDGYELSILDGINNSPEMWNLSFANVDLTTAQNIVMFFKDNVTATTSFDWVTPDGNAYKFLCKKWQRSFDSSVTATISCTFQQVFW